MCFRSRKELPAQSVDGWATLREALVTDADLAWKRDLDYLVVDDAMLMPIVQRVLDRRFRGEMPSDPAKVQRVIKAVRGSVKSAQTSDEQVRAQVEAKIRERYDNPRVAPAADGIITADHGFAPGPLETFYRAGFDIVNSDVVVNKEWAGTEAAKSLIQLREQHPDAPGWRAVIKVPPPSYTTLQYRWLRNQDRVVVFTADVNVVWHTDTLSDDLSAYTDGSASLHTSDLTRHALKDRAFWGEELLP